MSCLFGLESAMIRVVGTPPTATERDALTARSRQERRQVAEVFEAERAQPGSRFPWGGILVYCSLPESTRPQGEMRARFTAFDYPTGAWVPAVGSFGALINSMSGGDTQFFRSTIRIVDSSEYNGALLPGTASGFRLYAFRCACPPHPPMPNAVLTASAPLGSSSAAASHSLTRDIYDLELQGPGVVERCRRDFGLEWREIADCPAAVRDLPQLYAGSARQHVAGSALLALPWSTQQPESQKPPPS